MPTAACLFAGVSRKQETRDCKGIKILLDICPPATGERTSYLNWRSSRIWDWATWASCWVRFLLSLFLAPWASCYFPVLGFLCLLLLPWEISQGWAPAVFGLLLAGAMLKSFQPGLIWVMVPYMSGVWVISLILSCHNKNLKWRMLKPSVCHSSQTDQCCSSVTAQFYLENKGKYILKVWGHANPKDAKRGEREQEREQESACMHARESRPFGSSFFFPHFKIFFSIYFY